MIKSDRVLFFSKRVFLYFGLISILFSSSFAMGKKASELTDEILKVNIYYKEKILLPNNSVLTVYLEDISKADESAKVISTEVLKNLKSPPYKSELIYEASLLKENHQYSVRATIMLGKRLLFTSTSVINPFVQKKGSVISILVQSAKRANSNVNLMDTHWMLVQMGERKIKSLKRDKTAFLILESTKSSIKGSSGCNSFFGTYEHNKKTLSFGPIGSTQMMCENDEVMQVEFEFLQLLSSDIGWKIKGEILEVENYKLGLKAYLKRKVDANKVQYLCDKDEQLEVLYDKKNKTTISLYYKNQTILMRQHKAASGVKYIALDEQNSYRWHVKRDEGTLGFLKADHTAREEVLLHCNKK